MRILQAFSPESPTLPVTTIARRSGLPQATASRLVAEMIKYGLLAREPGGRVQVGVRLWELAQRAVPTLELREAAMPFMEDLHSVVGHHVQLGVLDGDEVLFLERLSAPRAVINITRIAGRLPLHASSSLRDRTGAVIAALSVIVPDDDHAHEHIPALFLAARGIGGALAAPRWADNSSHPFNENRGTAARR